MMTRIHNKTVSSKPHKLHRNHMLFNHLRYKHLPGCNRPQAWFIDCKVVTERGLGVRHMDRRISASMCLG